MLSIFFPRLTPAKPHIFHGDFTKRGHLPSYSHHFLRPGSTAPRPREVVPEGHALQIVEPSSSWSAGAETRSATQRDAAQLEIQLCAA